MAENTSQKKLGELFVELGTKGAGKMMGTLNGVSAQFLLTKNAAMQAVKPVVDFTKKTVNSAVNIQKLSVALGTSAIQIQKMQTVLKKYSLSESLLGDVEGLSSKLQQFWEKGIVDNNMIYAFQQLGLNIQDYDSSLESTLQLIDDISNAIKGLDTATQRQRLGEIGLSQDFLYAFTKVQGGFANLPNLANAITDEEIEKEVRLKEEFEQAKMDAERALQKALVDYIPKFTEAVKTFGNWVNKIPGVKKDVEKNIPKLIEGEQKIHGKTLSLTPIALPAIATVIVGGTISNVYNKSKGQTLPNGLQTMPELDTLGQSNLIGNKTVNVYQDIRTSDPVRAGNISANKIKQAERDVAEIQNLPPL